MGEIQAKIEIGPHSFDVSDLTEGTANQLPSMVVHGTSDPLSIGLIWKMEPQGLLIRIVDCISHFPRQGEHPLQTRIFYTVQGVEE
jgi:hypothetical protein